MNVVTGENGMDQFSKNKKTKAEHSGTKMIIITFLTPIYTVMIANLKTFFYDFQEVNIQ